MTIPLIQLFLCSSPPCSGGIVTKEQFKAAVQACGFPTPTDEQYNNAVTQIGKGDISTKMEFAMFLTQIIWESGGLQYKVCSVVVVVAYLGNFSVSLPD